MPEKNGFAFIVLCTRQAKHVINIVEKIALDEDAPALDKINHIIQGVFEYRAAHKEERIKFTRLFENETNLRLVNRINEYIFTSSTPLIRSIIEQGIREGVFNVAYPEESAELYIHLSSIMNYTITRFLASVAKHPENKEVIRIKTLFYEDIFGKILGTEPGKITLSATVMNNYFR